MKNLSLKAVLFAAFSIGLVYSCKHEPGIVGTNACLDKTIAVTGTATDVSSATATDGSISVTASGGSGFTYSLNNGPYQSSGTFSSLPAGNYAVIAKSSAGCIGSAQFTIANNDPCAATTVAVTATITNTSSSTASDGSIAATASGGTGFQYKLNSGTYQASGTFTGLAAGTYTITARTSNGCTGSGQFAISAGNVCGSKNIVVSSSTTGSDKCGSSGSITINASGSTGFSYQLNGGTYQTSNVFSNLAAGSYTIAVKDADNCTKSATATIGTEAAGPLFTSVKTLIMSQCKPCHVNGGNNGGVNFDNDCTIVAQKDRIKIRSVDEVPSPMPTNGSLTTTEKKKITDWINAGGKYSN